MAVDDLTPTQKHVVVVTFPAQGHVNPLLRLAKRIAAKGPLVTFSSTSAIGAMIAAARPVAGADNDGGVPVGKGRLRFEFLDDGGVHGELGVLMPHLESTGPAALAKLLRRQADLGRPVSCVVGNPFIPWAVDVADAAGVPIAVLWVQSCAVFSLYYHYANGLAEFPTSTDSDITVSLPGLPKLAGGEVPSFLLPDDPQRPLAEAILRLLKKRQAVRWLFANSFEELEADAIAALEKLSPVVPVGPLIELDDEDGVGVKTPRADLFKVADESLAWLDDQPARSVIYVSLGSIAKVTKAEMEEMAFGLKSTGRPFLWVVRSDSRELLPAGFLDTPAEASALAGAGMVVAWSPQDRVLAHRSLGCFVTHCGWNSTLEALAAGVPVVAYPQWGDQVTDAKFIVDVYRTGVKVSAPVKRGELRAAVEAVLDGPEAAELRASAARWRTAARKAAAAGGSSDTNIQKFVDAIVMAQ